MVNKDKRTRTKETSNKHIHSLPSPHPHKGNPDFLHTRFDTGLALPWKRGLAFSIRLPKTSNALNGPAALNNNPASPSTTLHDTTRRRHQHRYRRSRSPFRHYAIKRCASNGSAPASHSFNHYYLHYPSFRQALLWPLGSAVLCWSCARFPVPACDRCKRRLASIDSVVKNVLA